MADTITRLDRYTIVVNGARVRATEDQEQRIRMLSPEDRARFLKVMGLTPCLAHDPSLPEMYYVLAHPDGHQHCLSCHCICDPNGPTCGHTAGCPGC